MEERAKTLILAYLSNVQFGVSVSRQDLVRNVATQYPFEHEFELLDGVLDDLIKSGEVLETSFGLQKNVSRAALKRFLRFGGNHV